MSHAPDENAPEGDLRLAIEAFGALARRVVSEGCRRERRPMQREGFRVRAARRMVVHGRVQGVFFRDTVRRAAAERGVAGWVTNRFDGAVEAVFEGDEEAVEAMVEVAREGSRGANVERLDVSEEEPEGLEGFEVR